VVFIVAEYSRQVVREFDGRLGINNCEVGLLPMEEPDAN
jgi:hypothetical protein